MSVTDMKAAGKWSKIPKRIQQELLNNVFCATCGETTIVDYILKGHSHGFVIEGVCKTCGHDVARFIED